MATFVHLLCIFWPTNVYYHSLIKNLMSITERPWLVSAIILCSIYKFNVMLFDQTLANVTWPMIISDKSRLGAKNHTFS